MVRIQSPRGHHTKKKTKMSVVPEEVVDKEIIYVDRSCLLIHRRSKIRDTIIKIITSSKFDNLITFFIVANCIFLAIDGPTDLYDINNLTTKQVAIFYAEYIFLALFSIEMILKIIGLGFAFGPNTYLKNSWNWLDFSVVIIGYLSFVGVNNLSALRTFRVLRPLRTLTTVPGMKVIVVSMISALPALSGVVVLTLGMFFVWSVIGLQLWGGIMESRCYYPPTRQYDIPLVRCTSAVMPLVGVGANCNVNNQLPSSWTCTPVTKDDVFTIGSLDTTSSLHSTTKYTELKASHEFPLNRSTGLADIPYNSSSTEECRVVCLGCRTGSKIWYKQTGTNPKDVPVEIMLNLNQSTWDTTGELIFNAEQWPVPRNLVDRPLDEKARHGINVSATIEKLRLTKEGTVDLYGSEANKTVELVLYDGIAFTGGWDHGTYCGLPESQGVQCGTEQNGTVVVQGVCKQWWNPALGNGGFDGIGKAVMVIFTSVTLEGWVDNMYILNKTWGNSWFVVTYFVLLVAFGAFFVMNLAMAVIWDEYAAADAVRQEKEEQDQANQDMRDLIAAESLALEESKKPKLSVEQIAEQSAQDLLDLEEHRFCVAPGCFCSCSVRLMHKIVSSGPFDAFITLMIILNTITLALEFYDMPTGLILALEICNYIFSAVFLVEMIFKLWGLGFRVYAQDAFNLFDGVIVTFSVIELGVGFYAKATGQDATSTGLGALRTFRLLRVFKLARSWKDLQKLLLMIMQSVMDVTNAVALLGIIMFIFTLLGMQLFGGKMKWYYYGTSPGDKAKAHFDSFWWGFVTVFQVLTGENWNEVLYNTMWALDQPEEDGHQIMAVIYFILLNVVGNYMILNLFLAILLANFEGGEEEQEEEEEAESSKEEGTPKKHTDIRMAHAKEKEAVLNVKMRETALNMNRDRENSSSGEEEELSEQDIHILDLYGDMSKRPHSTNIYNYEEKSLCCMHGSNKFRQLIFKIMDHPAFDNFVLFLIFTSSVLLAYDEPTRLPHEKNVLKYFDWVISILFGFELLFKVISLGLMRHEGAYLRDGWNVLDCIIVIISFLSLSITGAKAVKALRSLRALRALKPLRVVRRYPGLRLVVNAIFRAMPRIANVVLVTMLFFVIFAIVGVQNFMGALRVCNDENIEIRSECVGTFNLTLEQCWWQPTPESAQACISYSNGTASREFPRMWQNLHPFNFDSVGWALLTLFEICSGEMWPDIMYDTVNAAGLDKPRLPFDAAWPANANSAVAIYYIAVTLVCGFLMLNVFVGVVIDEYNAMKGEEDGSGLMTDSQKQWVDSMKMLSSQNPMKVMTPPKSKWRMYFYTLVCSNGFEMFIMSAIVLNTIILALTITPDDGRAPILEGINFYCFALLFAAEMVVKMIGIGPKQYFSLAWNKFDFVLVAFSFVGRALDVGQLGSLLRIVRVARIFRLVKANPKVLTLFKTLIYSMPSLINVGIILMLLYFIFAIIGMNLFNGIKYGNYLNEDANFDTFGASFNTLFRCSTGESYNAIMYDTMIQPPYCNEESGNCGDLNFPPIYFTMFFVLQNYIFLNLIVAIILDVFADTNAMAENIVSDRHLDSFKEEWSKFDLNANKWIDAKHLKKLILNTEYPLGLKNFENQDTNGIDDGVDVPVHLIGKSIDEIEAYAQKICDEVDVYAHKHDSSYADTHDSILSDGFVYEISFQETLQQLAVRVGKISGKTLPGQIEAELAERMQKKREAQASAKRRQGTIGQPILVRQLEMMLNPNYRGGSKSESGSGSSDGGGDLEKKSSNTVSAQYVGVVDSSEEDSDEDRERGIV